MGILKDASRFVVTLILITAAHAAALPTDTVVQNINGVHQCVKTYTVAPDFPSEKLAEAPFERDGWLYTFSGMDRKENYFHDEKSHTETVTVKTSERELSAVISALPPSKDYDDGKYSGVLHLNASTIHTEAAGYETQSYAVSATREFADLDSNDMSYIPPTVDKDGVTLSLQSVDWQAQESELVEDMLIPSSYKAVAFYAGTGYRKAATGYVSAASYTGTVSCRLLKDVTYTVTYVGTPVESPPETSEEQPPQEPEELSWEEPEKRLWEAMEREGAPGNTETASGGIAPADTPEPSENERAEAEEPENGNPPEDAENLPEAETPETAEPSETPETDASDKDGGTSGKCSRLLYAGGGIIALIIIITAASAQSRRRKQRTSAYDYDDYPYYNDHNDGYGEPPYNGDGSPPYEPEDANAPYDNGPAPWEADAWNGEENPYLNADNSVDCPEGDVDIPEDVPPPECAEEAESADGNPDNGHENASGV